MNGDATYAVLVVEDEAGARDVLVNYLETRPRLRLAAVASNGDEAAKLLARKRFDLVFLDVNMPGLSGLEMLNTLSYVPRVIFTTAHEEFALKAFEFGAVDYLLKPITLDRFHRSVDRALYNISSEKNKGDQINNLGVILKAAEFRHFVKYEHLIYAAALGKHALVHTTIRGEIEALESLKRLEERLPGDSFLRIHKRFLVNLNFIGEIEYIIGGQYQAYLTDAKRSVVPIGRSYVELLNLR